VGFSRRLGQFPSTPTANSQLLNGQLPKDNAQTVKCPTAKVGSLTVWQLGIGAWQFDDWQLAVGVIGN
jgi:hypothetical protein